MEVEAEAEEEAEAEAEQLYVRAIERHGKGWVGGRGGEGVGLLGS